MMPTTTAQRFVRRGPRLPIHCAVMASYGSVSYFGRTVDLGRRGAGLRIGAQIPNGTSIWILLDPAGLPPALEPIGGVSLPGRVVFSRLLGSGSDGHLQYRLGVELQALVPDAADTLRAFVAGATERLLQDVATPMRRLVLSRSPEGREQLYQAARAAAEAGRFEIARAAIYAALSGDHDHREYRVLAARVRTEEALAARDVGTARRELDHALRLAPEDRSLRVLEARVDEGEGKTPRRRWFLGLFG